MSTELVAIERITIRKGDSNADDIRSCLAHYLLQFINFASIESLSMHKLSIKVDGKTVLFVQDKTGGVGLKGLDTDWQHTPEMSAILDQLVTDVDVEVFLSYEMIHYFSTENFYGYNFWSEVLQEYGCEAVRYKALNTTMWRAMLSCCPLMARNSATTPTMCLSPQLRISTNGSVTPLRCRSNPIRRSLPHR